jgi:hypothetical protein
MVRSWLPIGLGACCLEYNRLPAILPEAAVLLLAAAFVMGLDCRVPRGPGPMVALRYE